MLPLVLDPFLRPQVWGGTRLRDGFGKRVAAGEKIGESWEVSGYPLHISRVAEGPLSGISLNDLWRTHRDEWCPHPELRKSLRFPWLVKLLDCGDASSWQVHPNNEQAARLQPGETGKTEAWYVLQTDPGSRLYTGLQPGVTEVELRKHLAAGTVAEVLHAVRPQVGEAYLIPAGVPHAISAGLVLFEIEQCSDITLRLFDWNRVDAHGHPRQLHVEEALRCLDWQHPAVNHSAPRELPVSERGVQAQRMVTCEWFVMDRITVMTEWATPAEALAIWFVVNGSGVLETTDGVWSRTCHRGQTILAPPDSQPLRWTNQSTEPLQLLRCTWGDGQ